MNGSGALIIAILVYTVWGTYSTWKFFSSGAGRFGDSAMFGSLIKWVNSDGAVNKIVKAILSIIIGYLYGGIKLILLIGKTFAVFFRNM